MKNILIIILFSLLSMYNSIAQVTLSTTAITAQAGEIIEIPVYIRADAPTSIVGLQFALEWDAGQLTYQPNEISTVLSDFNQSNLGTPTQTTRNNRLNILWEDYPNTLEVDEKISLFTLHFQVNNDVTIGDNIEITLCSDCTQEVYNSNLEALALSYEIETSVLPIQLLNLQAKAQSNAMVQLNWTTANEYQNSHFDIQHSTNGRDWNTFGKVNGQGNTVEKVSYEFLHTDAPTGENMYRLEQFDTNGESTFSPIVSVALEAAISVLNYQNPVQDELILKINSVQEQKSTFSLYHANGQLVTYRELDLHKGQQTLTWDMSNLPQGLYLMKVMGDETDVLKIVKE